MLQSDFSAKLIKWQSIAETLGFSLHKEQIHARLLVVPKNQPALYAECPRISVACLWDADDARVAELILDPPLKPVHCEHCLSVTGYEVE